MKLLARLLKTIFGWLLALLILFEEWGWEPLQRALAWIGRWPGLRWIEGRIRALPPYGALGVWAAEGIENRIENFCLSERLRLHYFDPAKGSSTPENIVF